MRTFWHREDTFKGPFVLRLAFMVKVRHGLRFGWGARKCIMPLNVLATTVRLTRVDVSVLHLFYFKSEQVQSPPPLWETVRESDWNVLVSFFRLQQISSTCSPSRSHHTTIRWASASRWLHKHLLLEPNISWKVPLLSYILSHLMKFTLFPFSRRSALKLTERGFMGNKKMVRKKFHWVTLFFASC